jgi:hypothetical protein
MLHASMLGASSALGSATIICFATHSTVFVIEQVRPSKTSAATRPTECGAPD